MLQSITRLRQDNRGATAIEYGLIVALLFLGIVVAVSGFSASTVAMWGRVSDTTQEAVNRS